MEDEEVVLEVKTKKAGSSSKPRGSLGRPKGSLGKPKKATDVSLVETKQFVSISRLDKSITKKPRGGKKRYTPTVMRNRINQYFQWCEETRRVPSIKGLTLHLKMVRDQFYQYLTYPEFSNMMEQARLCISEWVENDIYHTPGQAAGKIAYAKNIQGWTDRLETNNTTEVKHISVDEARARIEMLAPQLLELLRSEMVVNQIAHKSNIVVEATVI